MSTVLDENSVIRFLCQFLTTNSAGLVKFNNFFDAAVNKNYLNNSVQIIQHCSITSCSICDHTKLNEKYLKPDNKQVKLLKQFFKDYFYTYWEVLLVAYTTAEFRPSRMLF